MRKLLLASFLLSAVAGCQNAQEVSTRRAAEVKLIEADKAGVNGDTKTRIRFLREALEITPNNQVERRSLASSLWCEGDCEESRRLMRIVAKSDQPVVARQSKVFLQKIEEFLKKHPNADDARKAAIDSCKMPPP